MDSTQSSARSSPGRASPLRALAESVLCVAIVSGLSLALYVGFGSLWAPFAGAIGLTLILTWMNTRRLGGYAVALAEVERTGERIERGEGLRNVDAYKLGPFKELGDSLNTMFG